MAIPKNAVHIVISGGPAAGKTTAMNYLYENLTGLGWRVILVPEAATIVYQSSGVLPEDRERKKYDVNAQKAIIELQSKLAKMLSIVLTGHEEKVVFLYDRAELDGRAYLSDRVFKKALKEATDMTVWEVAKKYDAVFHMVTAADGAEEIYTLANNTARTEDPMLAREVDEKTKQAWLGHSHFKVISNEGGFDYKLRRVLTAVLQVLGEPEPVEIEKKWVIIGTPDISSLNSIPVRITQVYLATDEETGEEARLRARTVQDFTTYYRTVKRPTDDPRVKIEEETVISYETYLKLLKNQEKGTKQITKTRWCFVYKNQFFELDHIESPIDLWLLESELLSKDDWVELPHHIGTIVDVIGNKTFTNKSIARGLKQKLPPPPYPAL